MPPKREPPPARRSARVRRVPAATRSWQPRFSRVPIRWPERAEARRQFHWSPFRLRRPWLGRGIACWSPQSCACIVSRRSRWTLGVGPGGCDRPGVASGRLSFDARARIPDLLHRRQVDPIQTPAAV